VEIISYFYFTDVFQEIKEHKTLIDLDFQGMYSFKKLNY